MKYILIYLIQRMTVISDKAPQVRYQDDLENDEWNKGL